MDEFDFSPYDLKDKDQRARAMADWKVWKKNQGFRIEQIRDKENGHTLESLAQLTDVFAHNISITLRETIDALGGRETEAGKVVSNLWHGIVSHELEVHLAVARLAAEAAVQHELDK